MKPLLANALWLARGSAEVLGWATAVSLIVFTVRIHQYEHKTGRRYATPPISISPVASQIAAKFSPALQDLATEHKDEITASAGNPVYRFAARQVFPQAVKAIPYGAEIGCDRALDYLDTLKVTEIAAMLVDHARAKSGNVDISVRRAAQE